MKTTSATPIREWAIFSQLIRREFGRDTTTDDSTPPRHHSTMDDYIGSFTAYLIFSGINDELHQVNFFIAGLSPNLCRILATLHPMSMHTAIRLAWEHSRHAATTTAAPFADESGNDHDDPVLLVGAVGEEAKPLAFPPTVAATTDIDDTAHTGNHTDSSSMGPHECRRAPLCSLYLLRLRFG